MKPEPTSRAKKARPFSYYLYLATILVLTISGFGQMPIFKRYYIADIPGLGWLAQFYTTHYMHYLAATVFIALTFYFIAEYLISGRKTVRITTSGRIRLVVLAGLLGSGILLVVRNLTGVHLSSGLIIFLDISHLGLVMALLLTSLYCVIFKKSWGRVKSRNLL